MPTIKRSLTRPGKLANLDRAKRMRAHGVDLQIREDWEESVRSLDIVLGGGFASMVFDLAGGSAGYAIWVRLVARWRVALTDCRLATDWDDEIGLVSFFDDREPLWLLGHQHFPRRQVLNMRIMNSLKFHGYDHMIEGMILATGRSIPETCHHGMTVPVTMALLDQNENEICQGGELFVDRTWKRKPTNVSQKSGLYDPVEIPETREAFVSQDSAVPTAADPDARFPRDRVGREQAESEQRVVCDRWKRQ